MSIGKQGDRQGALWVAYDQIPQGTGKYRWQGDLEARRAVYNDRARTVSNAGTSARSGKY